MIALYIVCLMSSVLSIAFSSETNYSVEVNSKEQNTTTLYPIKDHPLYFKDPKVQESVTKVEKEFNKQTDVAISKHNTYTQTDFKEAYKTIDADKNVISNKSNDINNDKEIPRNTEVKVKSSLIKEGTKWKIDTMYAPSKSIEGVKESRDYETKDKIKDFKPSPHLGSFYNEDSFVIPTPATEGAFIPYKPPSFGSYEKEFFKMTYKRPVDSYQTPIETPYRFENVPRTADWHIANELGPRPTMEPQKIPAGGLYKLPDAFQEKPNSDSDNNDFGLEFKEQKDNSVKKRDNPWKSFLHMVTALLPVGLIVSALTPSVITFENTDNNNPNYPSRLSRKADEILSSPPRISERCKRRLLCEIHADQNYVSNLSFSQRKPCYKIRCEDPHAVTEALRWLLDQRHTPSYRPADHDRRGYIIRN